MGTEKVSIIHDDRPIRQRPWIVRWYGTGTDTARPRRYSKAFKVNRDAEQFAATKRHEFDLGENRDRPRNIRLEQFSNDWLRAKKCELRPGTLGLYEEVLDKLMDYFGKTFLLENLTPRHASMFMASVKRVKVFHNDKPLSEWSRAGVLRNAKAICQTAVEWELLRRNPFKPIKSPKLTIKRWHYITPEEYKRLMEIAPTLYWKAFYALAYTAGLRFGELASLTWADIDWQKSEVHVCSKPGTSTMPPFLIKDHEERAIPIPKHTVDILSALHAEAPLGIPYVLVDRERYHLIVKNWQECQTKGRAWSNRNMMNNVLRDFRAQAKRAGIRSDGVFNIHCFRKSCGQNWADHLPIHVVKELMGHSDISTTQKFYNQVEQYQRRKAATVMQELIGDEEKEEDAKTG